MNSANFEERPWGSFEVLSDTDTHKVKRIIVSPGGRLSYQRHKHRSEHWYIVHGKPVVTLEGKDIQLAPGQAVDIQVGSWHRIKNDGEKPVTFIEIQTGTYFGEDDIERSEDDYGRK